MGDAVTRAGTVMAIVLLAAGCDRVQGKNSAAPASSKESSVIPRPAVPPGEVAAKVNQGTVSRDEVQLVLQNLRATVEAGGEEWQSLTDDQLRELLDGLVTAELKLQDALARGLDRDTETQRRLLLLLRNFYAQEWDRSQLDQITVSQQEVEQFYEVNKASFRTPERIKIRQIVVDAEDQAKAVLVRLLEGIDFETLAQQSSLEPQAAGGPMADQWVMRSAEKALYAPQDETMRELRDPAVEQAAFSMSKVGGVSSYVEGADGRYHIFQLVDRQPSATQPLVDVQDRLRLLMQLQRIDERARELREKAKIDLYPERLSDLQTQPAQP
jgi:parvulin-like peptidyl-prolyl isomerase